MNGQKEQGAESAGANARRGRLKWLTPPFLVRVIGIYSILAVGLISFFVLTSDVSLAEKAFIKMALGLNLIWVILGGALMVAFRGPVKKCVRRIPFPWQVTFFLFCTLLALIEEGVTVSMTNLASLFGVEVGQAFITASANYLHTVLFHSVIVFIPMFLVWTILLRYFAFSPAQVFLLFSLTGSLAEMSMAPTSVLAGFWFFV